MGRAAGEQPGGVGDLEAQGGDGLVAVGQHGERLGIVDIPLVLTTSESREQTVETLRTGDVLLKACGERRYQR